MTVMDDNRPNYVAVNCRLHISLNALSPIAEMCLKNNTHQACYNNKHQPIFDTFRQKYYKEKAKFHYAS